MSVGDFSGDTFVAFTDISGFKEMMKGDGKRAVNALDKLNSAGFNALREYEDINGFFISDCGVLFVKNQELNKKEKLTCLLNTLAKINKNLIRNDIMLTTSIAFGAFSYHNRIEFDGIQKNPIYGNAYVSAFLDNETGLPRLQPGECRILSAELEEDIFDESLLIKKKGKHHYHYWMVDSANEIPSFEKEYKDSYQLKYSGMLSALKQRNR